jgi:hypothetical protein
VADGPRVGIAYEVDDSFGIRVRFSWDSGKTFSGPTTVGYGGLASFQMLDDRFVVVAMAGAAWEDVWVRVRSAGQWESRRWVPDPSALAEGSPAVALRGTTELGIAEVVEVPRRDPADEPTSMIAWRRSIDDGATWGRRETVSLPGRWSLEPSVIWEPDGAVFVQWTGAMDEGGTAAFIRRGMSP